MGDLDINLIREYAKRPGLYDRNSPYYKDRMYITQTWNEISQKLGFEVRLLKERMLQLRNRYNLEKRRIDAIKSKYPNRIVRSQWALFMHMDFMNGHIKHRRSFSKMTTRQYRLMAMEGETNSKSTPMVEIPHNNGVTSSSNNSAKATNHNSEIEVKCENNVEFEEDLMNTDQDNFIDDDILDGTKNSPKDEYFLRPQITLSQPDVDSIRIRNTENGRPSIAIDDDSCQYEPTMLPPLYDAKEKKHLARLQKYESFGKFLASSLCDLPDLQAMKLVEKFTSDVVRSFLTINNVPVSNGASTSNTQSNHNHHPVIQNVETVTKDEQHESLIPPVLSQNKSDSDELPTVKKNADETAVIPTSNSNSNNFEADEYDEDHFIYDLTEDEPLSV